MESVKTKAIHDAPGVSIERLLALYCGTFGCYTAIVVLLRWLEVEAITGHLTPFYALYEPALEAKNVPWHLLALSVGTLFFFAWRAAMKRTDWFNSDPSPRFTLWMLAGLTAFAVLFPMAVAMVRGGPECIASAYNRHGYEYVGDIGVSGTIRNLFQQYPKFHEYLSMHAKVHPPGPIALLWMMSYICTQSTFALSIGTIMFGALAVIPLYAWSRDMFGPRIALTCAFVYTVVPSIVLFSATSADILFMPFTITTLFLFWRALHRKSIGYALAAGVFYGLLSLLSFSLVAIGAFFGFVGLWRLKDREHRFAVLQTALLMLAAFFALHVAVYLWSGFDIIECFHMCKAQFMTDQMNLDLKDPRWPAWAWKFANPWAWFFFAGIPVSVLFLWRLIRRDETQRGLWIVFALTLLALDLLYLARGEGERSAMYVLPFLVLPAGQMLDSLGRQRRSLKPLALSLAFMAIQAWLIESVLYTWW
jgi:hypothetical protein